VETETGLPSPITLVLPFIALSAALTIYGEMSDRPRLVYIFKPLTTVLIVILAAVLPANSDGRYRPALLIGLLFSLAGDVFLMLPGDRFIAGVAAFLAAHLAYLTAFTSVVPFAASPASFAVVALVVAAILFVLWGKLPGRMRAPLVVYAVVLGTMAAQAISQGIVLGSPAANAGALGGVLFLASDSTLVTNRFARPFRFAPLAVLGTYYAAQVLIAASVMVTAP
jgi:uncharacterized membrane protein YhhN